ncbi:8303_t:CDS:2 [Scutellospora calospora]|uniref:8303_t:CDS:1 n=1 Tax=Scutellospora calospora TaxID=85575 RepID=A0ACA9JUX6_9GLOM|nr:8303_t:CDS:2 [Scutellospora calospora]
MSVLEIAKELLDEQLKKNPNIRKTHNKPTIYENPLLFQRPPFPPLINLDENVKLKHDGTVPTMSSNSFMIYRKYYIDNLKSQNVKIPMMTIFSPVIANSWKNEPLHQIIYDLDTEVIFLKSSHMTKKENIKKNQNDKLEYGNEFFFNENNDNEYLPKEFEKNKDNTIYYLDRFIPIKQDIEKQKDSYIHYPEYLFNNNEYKKRLYWYHVSNRYYFLKYNHRT